VDASNLRRWVEDRRAVAARERAEARSTAPADSSIAQALALVALYGRLHGWPVPEDAISRREDAQAYDRWYMLKRKVSFDR
jgi:Flp pilus assembly protein TadD